MEFKDFKNRYADGFLADELISHDSDQFLYIADLHGFLWAIIRTFNPGASGTLDDYADSIIPQLDTLRKSLDEVKAERDEIITVAHNRGVKDEIEIDDLKAERDRLKRALEEATNIIARVCVHVFDIKEPFGKVIHDDIEEILPNLEKLLEASDEQKRG